MYAGRNMYANIVVGYPKCTRTFDMLVPIPTLLQASFLSMDQEAPLRFQAVSDWLG